MERNSTIEKFLKRFLTNYWMSISTILLYNRDEFRTINKLYKQECLCFNDQLFYISSDKIKEKYPDIKRSEFIPINEMHKGLRLRSKLDTEKLDKEFLIKYLRHPNG